LVVLDPDAALMRLDRNPAKGEAKPFAQRATLSVCVSDAYVLVEDPIAEFDRDTGTVVADAKTDDTIGRIDLDPNRLTRRAVPYCVVDEVLQHAAQQLWVGVQVTNPGMHLGPNFMSMARGHRRHQLLNIGHELRNVDRRAPRREDAVTAAGDVEEIQDHPADDFRRRVDQTPQRTIRL
jgi:hypothetical protein